mmetsp:Transcript_26174/g.54631  ORF Transcript_26174/g.54631 Transcript_26174/m.54631 type:complete len:109 (-) Transcript_26174:127-453(-)
MTPLPLPHDERQLELHSKILLPHAPFDNHGNLSIFFGRLESIKVLPTLSTRRLNKIGFVNQTSLVLLKYDGTTFSAEVDSSFAVTLSRMLLYQFLHTLRLKAHSAALI